MELQIRFPDDLRATMALETESIPCFSQVSDTFELQFREPLPEAVGTVTEWSKEDLCARSPALGGSKWLYRCPSMVTLTQCGEDLYQIISLYFYSIGVGWHPIIKDGVFSEPGAIADEDV